MLGINAIAGYLPENTISNLERCHAAGKTESFINNRIGFQRLTRKDVNDDTSDLCVKSFQRLLERGAVDKERIDCIVVCTQNPDGFGLPHTAAIVQAALGLSTKAAAFDISLGCSGYVYSLSLIQAFMRENDLVCGLLFTADPYSKVIDPSDFDTELLFGDAASVTLINGAPLFRTMKSVYGTNGSLAHSIRIDKETGKLKMLGNNVFKFTMTVVPEQVQMCLGRNEIGKDEIDLFLFHQGSKFIVDNLVRRLDIPPNKAPFLATNCGNTVSSTIPLMLETYLRSPAKRILISGFGVGLSWGTTILERV
jgi:3-oxoacyl-[acyl-carrier-protein] synthase-3